jgi:hypothetical protein
MNFGALVAIALWQEGEGDEMLTMALTNLTLNNPYFG